MAFFKLVCCAFPLLVTIRPMGILSTTVSPNCKNEKQNWQIYGVLCNSQASCLQHHFRIEDASVSKNISFIRHETLK